MRRTNSERSVLLSNGGAGSRSGPPSGGGGSANSGGGGGASGYAPAAPTYHLPHLSSSGGGAFYHQQHSLSGGGLPLHHGHPSLGALGGYGSGAGAAPRRQGSGSMLLPRSGSGGGMAGALLSALQQPQQTALALLTGDSGGGGKGLGPPLSGGGGGGGSSSAASPLAPFVGWLRALLLLAVVGFVLLDVALFEAVVARTSSAPRSPALMADGVAGAAPAVGAMAAGGLGGNSGNNDIVNVGGLAAATPPPEEDVDAALIELPKVLPSQAAAAARLAAAAEASAAAAAATAATAIAGGAALQDAPPEGSGKKGKKHGRRHANPVTARPAVTLLLQHGLLPPLPPQTPAVAVASAAGRTAATDSLAALPAAFRLPPPTKPASVRALATSTVGPAPMLGLRAGAAAAANPSRVPSAAGGAAPAPAPGVTTEAARAAAVSLFGPDVFAAEERAAAGKSADDDDYGEGGAKTAANGGNGANKAPKTPAATRRRRLPPGFDWRAYLEYNPDVRAFGVNTAATAAGHYLAYGAKEGRLHRRIPLAVRYTACGGLANQHYSHVAALTLAVALGGDVLLPDAARRDTFAHYFSEDPTKNKVQWLGAPLGSMWQVSSAAELLRAAGNDAALAPNGTTPPDLSRPSEAFQTYGLGPAGVIGPGQVVRLEGVYQKALPLADLVDEARELAVRAAMAAVSGARQAAVARGERDAETDPRYDLPPPVILDLPCALFSVEALDSPLAAAVARQLRFAPHIAALADRVVAAIAAGGGGPPEEAANASAALAAARKAALEGAEMERRSPGGGDATATAPRTAAQLLAKDPRFWRSGAGGFNGLHLRVEADAKDWLRAMGGREAFWGAYLALLREAGFGTDDQARASMVAPVAAGGALSAGGASLASASSAAAATTANLSRPGLPLYVATGLPSYAEPGSKAARSLDELRERLAVHGARLVLKEDVLPQAELSALAPDQLALVDFLVLVRSRAFVGVSASTFSVLVREYRSLHGVAGRDTAFLVDSTPVGSEPLFARAAVLQTGDAPPVLGSHGGKAAGGRPGGGGDGGSSRGGERDAL